MTVAIDSQSRTVFDILWNAKNMRNTTKEQVRELIILMGRKVEVEMGYTQLAAQLDVGDLIYARMAAIHQDSNFFLISFR